MPSYLIDTDVIIHALKGNRDAIDALDGLGGGDNIAFSVISEAELYVGVAPSSQEAADLHRLLEAMERMLVDGPIARRAGAYRREFGRSHGTGLPDALIAATATQLGAKLVTGNRRHFPMRDIEVVDVAELARKSGKRREQVADDTPEQD